MNRPGFRHCIAAMALAVTVSSSAKDARAGDVAAADALFADAKALMDKKDYAAACPKFEASAKLDRALGTLLNVADCNEKLGRIATAWGNWGDAADLAAQLGDGRLDLAKQRRSALEPRLARLKIDAKSFKGLEIYRDEERVDPAAYGLFLPIDPGAHVITVRRDKDILRSDKLLAEEKANDTLTIDLAALEKAAPRPKASPPASSYRKAGYATAGGGAALIVAAGLLELGAKKARDGANCATASGSGAVYCTQTGMDDMARAKRLASTSQWVGIGGLVVGAVGVTMILTSSKSSSTTGSSVSLHPWVGATGGGLILGGTL